MKIKNKLIFYSLLGVAGAACCAGALCGWTEYNAEKTAIRSAVSMRQLKDVNGVYIICERCRVTGFDWHVTGSNTEGHIGNYCNIIGADPFSELHLDYEFIISDNRYVFYVEEARLDTSREAECSAEYRVSGWDIVYPVRRNEPELFGNSRKYILESDADGR